MAVAVQTTSECACVADLVGARILVGSVPWAQGPAGAAPPSAANYTLCAAIKGIVRGQRQLFTCASVGGAPPVGQYIAIWRPSTAKRQLTLCEVDAVFAEVGAQGVPDGAAAEQPQAEQPAAAPARRRRMLGGLSLRQ